MPKSKEEISDHLSAILKDLAKENMALLNFIESLNQSDAGRNKHQASGEPNQSGPLKMKKQIRKNK